MSEREKEVAKERREVLYGIGILINAILVLGTVGALECENITLLEAMWQVVVAVAGALVWVYLFFIEETRAAKVVHRKKYILH